MAKKKEVGSKLLKALGKTKKEQMAKLYPKAIPPSYPKVKGKIRGKGPYLRGKVMGSGDFLDRRAAVAGTKATKKKSMSAAEMAAHVVGAGATGYAVGKGWHKKLVGAMTPKKKEDTHLDKARKAAEKGIKKQKSKKEKRKSHH